MLRKVDDNYSVTDDGRVYSHRRDRWLKVVCSPKSKHVSNHYGRVHINGKSTYVHRLVAEAFIPNPESLPQVNHQDRDKGNNRADNLEWVTGQENMDHAAENMKRGGDHYAAKLTEPDVLEMRWLRSLGVAVAEIAEAYGVAKRTARDAITGKTWRHV